MGGVGVGRRGEAVGDGFELEIGEALDGVRAAGPDEAVVVEFGVDEGDEEAVVMEELGEAENGGYVALSRVWDDDCVWLLLLLHGFFFTYLL